MMNKKNKIAGCKRPAVFMRKYIALFFMSAMIILTMAGCQTTPDTAASSGEQAQATGQASEEAATAEDQTTDAGSSQEEAEAAIVEGFLA